MQYFSHTLKIKSRTTKHKFKHHSLPIRVSSYRKSINKLLYTPLNIEGKVDLKNSAYNRSIYKGERIIQGKKVNIDNIEKRKYYNII